VIKKVNIRKITGFTFILFLLAASTLIAADKLEVKNAWVREAPPGMKMTAGYMTFVNDDPEDITVKSISSPQFGFVEMHRTEMNGDRAKMVRQNQIILQGNSSFPFMPGGYHLMLMEPVKQFKEGDIVEFKLSLGNGETFSFSSPVQKDTGGDMHHMKHGE
jgi:copper(I)-binding protein